MPLQSSRSAFGMYALERGHGTAVVPHTREMNMRLTQTILCTAVGAAIAASAAAQGGPGKRRYAMDADNTPGWTLMTPAERSVHQQKMWASKTYDECKAVQAEHHTAMEARAKEQGKTLRAPGVNACDRMRTRGMIQ